MSKNKALLILILWIIVQSIIALINNNVADSKAKANTYTIDSLKTKITALELFNTNLKKTIVKDFKAFSYINCPSCQKEQRIDTFDLITIDDTRSQINKCKYCNSLFQISKTLVVSKFKL